MPVRRPLQFVTPTMRLAKPVIDADGRVLIGVGTCLDERVLRLLRRQAIQAVVVDEPEDVGAWETIRPLSEEMTDLEARFQATERSAALDELRDAVGRLLVRRAARFRTDDGGNQS